MNKFSEYIKTNVQKDVSNNTHEEMNMEQLEDIIEKYNKLSPEELMSEFIKESNKIKQHGGLEDNQIKKIENVLKPYLNEQQQNMFDSLMMEIRDEK